MSSSAALPLRAEVLNKESERDVWSQDMVADTDAIKQIGPAVLASGTDEYGVSKVLPSPFVGLL